MSITLLFGCCQIETCTSDLDAVRGFLIDILGGELIEQELARQISELIPGDDYDVDHIDCGGAVFQVNQPSPDMTYGGQPSIHQRYLEEQGPCVTNLNWFVDDIEHARELLTGLGAVTHIEGPSSAANALADYGPDNTRAGGDERPFLFMGTRHLIGFDLEIMEPNFLHFAQQTAQYPAFVFPRPTRSADNLLLDRLVVVVSDLEAALANADSIFAPASRSKPYASVDDTEFKSVRIGIGGIEVEFIEPRESDTRYGELLAGNGPGVAEIAFGTTAQAEFVRNCDDSGIACYKCGPGVWRISCRDIVGFDVLLEPRMDCADS